jgi:hypothetical protein
MDKRYTKLARWAVQLPNSDKLMVIEMLQIIAEGPKAAREFTKVFDREFKHGTKTAK